MGQELKLVGLDFGSTTCSAVVAGARLHEDRLTGRRELVEVTPRYRSELAFTPFVERPDAPDEPDEDNELIDLEAAARLLDGWLAAGDVRGPELFGGGALITGLCARKANAARLAELVRARLGEAVIATADDPCLESLVAFLGSCGELSRGEPQRGKIGQPSIPMSLNPDGAYFLGLKIGRRSAELVLIDFLIRHGFIGPEEPDYLPLIAGLRRPIPFQRGAA